MAKFKVERVRNGKVVRSVVAKESEVSQRRAELRGAQSQDSRHNSSDTIRVTKI